MMRSLIAVVMYLTRDLIEAHCVDPGVGASLMRTVHRDRIKHDLRRLVPLVTHEGLRDICGKWKSCCSENGWAMQGD